MTRVFKIGLGNSTQTLHSLSWAEIIYIENVFMITCVVCGESDSEILYPSLKINRCRCGHIYYTGGLGEEEIKNLYSEDYFMGGEYADYKNDKNVIQRNFRNRLKVVKRYISNGKLLEIGSAYGFFLDLAREIFDVIGYEMCSEAAECARSELKLDVRDTDFVKENLGNKIFDVVCLWDCIEHLPSPQLFIEKINTLLKLGGYLFITTGDIGSLLPRIQGKAWRLIHPPTHVHYFSRKSITNLLKHFQFEVIEVRYPGIWRSNRQLVAELFKLKKLARYIPGCFWLNTFDIMEVIAKKQEDYRRK